MSGKCMNGSDINSSTERSYSIASDVTAPKGRSHVPVRPVAPNTNTLSFVFGVAALMDHGYQASSHHYVTTAEVGRLHLTVAHEERRTEGKNALMCTTNTPNRHNIVYQTAHPSEHWLQLQEEAYCIERATSSASDTNEGVVGIHRRRRRR
jgi:hypothetical protein